MTRQHSVVSVSFYQPDFQPIKNWHVTTQTDLKTGRYEGIKQPDFIKQRIIKKWLKN